MIGSGLARVGLVLALVGLTACQKSSAASAGSAASLDPTTFAVSMASPDLYVGAPQRVQVGVFNSTQNEGVQLVTSGSVEVSLTPSEGPGTPINGTATYVPAPGTSGQDAGEPTLTSPDVARGVYQLEPFSGADVAAMPREP